jgi:hypothetical protein
MTLQQIENTFAKSFQPLFFAYIASLIILPTGSLFGVNIKVVLFLLLLVVAFPRFVKNADNMGQIAALLVLPMFLIIWFSIGVIGGFELSSILLETRDFLTAFVSCWLIGVFISTVDGGGLKFLVFVIKCVAFTSVLKVLILLYSAYSGVAVSDIIERISELFGIHLMSIDIEGVIGRILWVSDILIPFCIFALCGLRKVLNISEMKTFIFLNLMVFSSLLTFSRYLWPFTLFAMALGFLIAKWEKFHWFYVATLASIVVYKFDSLLLVVATRYSDSLVDFSDKPREYQAIALNKFFWQAPLFGHGLGSYAWWEIRGMWELKYAYENQIKALAGQMGIVGLAILLTAMLLYLRKSFVSKRTSTGYKIILFSMLVMFIVGGYYNPQLISSTAAVVYGVIRVLGDL